jgi:hypothetical protein
MLNSCGAIKSGTAKITYSNTSNSPGHINLDGYEKDNIFKIVKSGKIREHNQMLRFTGLSGSTIVEDTILTHCLKTSPGARGY